MLHHRRWNSSRSFATDAGGLSWGSVKSALFTPIDDVWRGPTGLLARGWNRKNCYRE